MLEKIKAILAEFTDADVSGVTEDTDIQFDLGFDSLQLMNLAVALEKEFGVTISDEDAAAISTVADVIRLVG
ncbi:MAG: acyl carrier protein [Clostridia bacterium]|nr:acyl carrier protein [Clostridia bacterium]MBR5428387.1 acyl carrier protein [Clostridia bacterium]